MKAPLYCRLGLSRYEEQVIRAREPGEVESRGFRYRLTPAYDEEKVIEAARGARVLAVNSMVPLTARVIQGLEGVELIIVCTSGYDNVDLSALHERGLPVARLADVRRDEVVEHTLAMTLTLLRRVSWMTREMEKGLWWRGRMEEVAPTLLSGAVVGLVGLGVIGRAAARAFRTLGATVLGCDPAGPPPEDVEMVPLQELLARSSVVSLHVSLNSGSRGLIRSPHLEAIGPGGILINTSRGAVLSGEDLHHALSRGLLGAAGLDVFEEEPPPWIHATPSSGGLGDPRDEVKNLPCGEDRWAGLIREGRLLATPHCAGYSPMMPHRLVDHAMALLDAFLAGKPLPHPL